jgi:D-glycero-alpha-D-manno-heptose-7-phosphate kinase
MMIVRSKTPLRISFSGGGTDVSPYREEYGGAVLSATIGKYAYASLRVRDDRRLEVTSLDYDIVAKYNLDDMNYDGQLDLVKAVVKNQALNKDLHRGFDVFIHSDAPPGSGLGSSSAVVVGLIGLLKHAQGLQLTNDEIARLAFHIEREDVGIKGGMQDQYAAAFGGFNLIEFGPGADKPEVVVSPLRIDADIMNELEYRLLLCYTGRTRLSDNIISEQMDAYTRHDGRVLRALEELKQITTAMKDALVQRNLDDLGRLLHEAWQNKKKMASQITNSSIDTLYEAALKSGAIGGKLLGAGGGGYLLLYCAFDRKHAVAAELERLGGQLVEFTFERHGLQTWEVQP